MFYLFEILTRVKYIIFSFCLLVITCYFNYNTIFTFFDYHFRNLLNGTNIPLLNYYIYTHPFELYYTQLIVSFQISMYLLFPYLIWQFIDFNKTALYETENRKIQNMYKKFMLFFVFSYLFFFIKVLPMFFSLLNAVKLSYSSVLYQIFFELKVQDFIGFILYLNNIIIILLLFLYFLINIINYIELLTIIKHKKILYLLAILISTFLSPPDIFSQLFLLISLLITLETIIFIKVYKYYKNKIFI